MLFYSFRKNLVLLINCEKVKKSREIMSCLRKQHNDTTWLKLLCTVICIALSSMVTPMPTATNTHHTPQFSEKEEEEERITIQMNNQLIA